MWVLLLRRFPVGVPVLWATGTGRISSVFIAWSGPLGVAAIYYLAFIERYRLPEYERMFLAGSLAVTVSVIGQAFASAAAVHGYSRLAGTEVPEGEEVELDGKLP